MDSLAQREKMLGTSIPKLITSLSIPTIIGQLITVIYNAADTYFVSQISTQASAAVGIVFSLQSLMQAIGFGLAMGAGSLSSIALGKKEDDKAHTYASSSLFAGILFGTIFMIVGLITLKPLMILLGSTDTILEYSIDYATYILLAAPVFCGSVSINNLLRSEGQATNSMIGIACGGILNMILDPIFINVFNLGIKGAGIATGISQTISFIVLYIMIKRKSIIKVKFKYISFNIKTYLKIISTGSPTILRQGLGALATTLLNNQAKAYGDIAIAAVSIANKVYMLIRNIVLGFGQGMQPVIGYNYGAREYKRVRQAFLFTTFIGTITCIFFTVLTIFFKEYIILFFRDDKDVIELGVRSLNFYCLSIPLLAFSTFVNQMYQSLGFKVIAGLLASCRQGIFYIPLIFILPSLFGIDGILAVQSISDILTCLVSIPFIIFFFREKLHLDKIKLGVK